VLQRHPFQILHSITPEELHTLLVANQEVLLFDVRQPLDLLASSEIIPGAKRIPPKAVLEDPSLIPREKDSTVYCTCPSDKTSRAILHRVRAMRFIRIKSKVDWRPGKRRVIRSIHITCPFTADTFEMTRYATRLNK
jgi:rhodanese-related sulfurtransferase